MMAGCLALASGFRADGPQGLAVAQMHAHIHTRTHAHTYEECTTSSADDGHPFHRCTFFPSIAFLLISLPLLL